MPESDSTVLFRVLSPQVRISPEEKRTLRGFARKLTNRVTGGKPFVCVIADDAELGQLNKSFLGHDYPTDVLSFPSQAEAAEAGELIISVERAAKQALEFGHDRITEICILMLHGVLHLCGMDHEKDEGEMERAEQNWRSKFELPGTLIARARRVG
jgi:probable rRNA maturation factor